MPSPYLLLPLEADPCHLALEGGGGLALPSCTLRPRFLKCQHVTQPTHGLGTEFPEYLFPVGAAQPPHLDSLF